MLKKLKISDCGTHHLKAGIPLYSEKFSNVLKYHEPGLAPVIDASGAYHIKTDGSPAYDNRYIRTFGFYDGKAAVETNEGSFHIFPNGDPVYPSKFRWCGNYQEEKCVVRDFKGNYFHINDQGGPLYSERYNYVGDFKDGIAVICNQCGKHTHIDEKGNFIHDKWFDHLDIFHKGFARAKDSAGWFHVDVKGNSIYEERFTSIEPFYNGVAYVERKDGTRLLLSEKGDVAKIINTLQKQNDFMGELSGDMVGFWKTWTIRTAVDLKLFESLPGILSQLSEKTLIKEEFLLRILRGLWELDIVEKNSSGDWSLTQKGQHLIPTENSFMHSAGYMWSRVNDSWKELAKLMRESSLKRHISFKELEKNEESVTKYLKALDGYNACDFTSIGTLQDWSKHELITGLGRASATILPKILDHHKDVKTQFLGEPFVIKNISSLDVYKNRLLIDEGNLLTPLSKKQDAIILPRYMHYWPDSQATLILNNAKESLKSGGKLYIFEMILEENSSFGGMFDLNMMAETGGKVRTLQNWKEILLQVGMEIEVIQGMSQCLSLMQVKSL
ncbi:MAG: hypothetical protein HON43_04345 [Alphaproteobacteria bacterium]|jgi:hypothetical protein|nr:hypothetical protein [Alphaproteobacteria bacterium]MBT5390325.1 hypothetical protein [Alphaproteobacteria bacterium]